MKSLSLKNKLILIISIDRLNDLANKPEWNKTPMAKQFLQDIIAKRVALLGEISC